MGQRRNTKGKSSKSKWNPPRFEPWLQLIRTILVVIIAAINLTRMCSELPLLPETLRERAGVGHAIEKSDVGRTRPPVAPQGNPPAEAGVIVRSTQGGTRSRVAPQENPAAEVADVTEKPTEGEAMPDVVPQGKPVAEVADPTKKPTIGGGVPGVAAQRKPVTAGVFEKPKEDGAGPGVAQQGIKEIPNLIDGAFFIGGAAFSGAGQLKLKVHADNPTQVPLGQGLGRVGVDAVLPPGHGPVPPTSPPRD